MSAITLNASDAMMRAYADGVQRYVRDRMYDEMHRLEGDLKTARAMTNPEDHHRLIVVTRDWESSITDIVGHVACSIL